MSEVILFSAIFGGLFVLRVIFATVFFVLVLPAGDRCPNCDAETLRVASPVVERVLPWLRRSWCLRCGWHGMLRRGPLSEARVETTTLTRR